MQIPDFSGTVTILSDFGQKMGYVGQMKGVILAINPQVTIVDITNEIEAQNISQAAIILENSAPYFKQGSIHLAVVDPGVGSNRKAVAILTNKATYVGPDNGLFGYLQKSEKIIAIHQISNPDILPDKPSSTFHGRDIFAPAAAYLSLGMNITELGEKLDKLTEIKVHNITSDKNTIKGSIIATDSFGNLITSITIKTIDLFKGDFEYNQLAVQIDDQKIKFGNTFSDVEQGGFVAYIGSGDRLEIAINLGNAATSFENLAELVIRLIKTG